MVAQIEGDVRILADRGQGDRMRAEALRFLIHFVADLHQPLHAEDNDDKGGNNVRVALGRRRVSLHRIWDGDVVEAQLAGTSRMTAVTLPISSISYAPFGDSVFIVEDVKDPKGKAYRGVRQQFVKLGAERGDQVAVLTGVKPGEEVVSSGVFKLRPGAAVQVNNSIQPGNNPKPKPEDS